MDVVIVRENEEDTYAGIEYRQTADVYKCLKLISRPGSEKIVIRERTRRRAAISAHRCNRKTLRDEATAAEPE